MCLLTSVSLLNLHKMLIASEESLYAVIYQEQDSDTLRDGTRPR